MFMGLPDPDQLVRGVDPDPSLIIQSSRKTSKKNLDSYCFVTSFGLFIFEKLCSQRHGSADPDPRQMSYIRNTELRKVFGIDPHCLPISS
jgi:hypothetical protein